MESILTSIKKMLNIVEETVFDPDIIIHINTVFMTLNQLGVGPEKVFSIEDDLPTWNDFLGESEDINAVKTYMYLKVRLLFDPPLNSSITAAFEKQASELEWRLNVNADTE